MVQIGQMVNSFTIVAIAYREANSANSHNWVILGESDKEYVTAQMDPDHPEEWYWGHYIPKVRDSALPDAWDDFTSRVL